MQHILKSIVKTIQLSISLEPLVDDRFRKIFIRRKIVWTSSKQQIINCFKAKSTWNPRVTFLNIFWEMQRIWTSRIIIKVIIIWLCILKFIICFSPWWFDIKRNSKNWWLMLRGLCFICKINLAKYILKTFWILSSLTLINIQPFIRLVSMTIQLSEMKNMRPNKEQQR